ncbi:unnamed protein product, partial [Owenia fusiformis]
TKESIQLDPCNGYLRKLIYQTVQLRFKNDVHLEAKTLENKQRCIVVARGKSENDLKQLEEAKKEAEWQELEDAVGFSKVIRHISQSGKLVVGHNMFLDLLHTLHHFCAPLPEDYEEFKAMVSCVLPRIIDTKLMANTQPFKDRIVTSALGELQTILTMPPFSKVHIEAVDGFPNYENNSDSLHEAGYDAYVTGLCYIGMANYLGSMLTPAVKHALTKPELTQPFSNRIFLMRVHDIPYMNMSGEEEKPNRDHVFHIRFPKEWKTADIAALFTPVGNVQVVWLNDTSAFVALYRKDQAHHVLKMINKPGEQYYVMTYEAYHAGLHTMPPPSASRKRRPPTSDVDLPPRKKASPIPTITKFNLDASPFVSRKITPIMEEEGCIGSEEVSLAESDTCKKFPSSPEDLGEPVLKRSKILNNVSDKTKSNSGEKLFEEEPW